MPNMAWLFSPLFLVFTPMRCRAATFSRHPQSVLLPFPAARQRAGLPARNDKRRCKIYWTALRQKEVPSSPVGRGPSLSDPSKAVAFSRKWRQGSKWKQAPHQSAMASKPRRPTPDYSANNPPSLGSQRRTERPFPTSLLAGDGPEYGSVQFGPPLSGAHILRMGVLTAGYSALLPGRSTKFCQ